MMQKLSSREWHAFQEKAAILRDVRTAVTSQKRLSLGFKNKAGVAARIHIDRYGIAESCMLGMMRTGATDIFHLESGRLSEKRIGADEALSWC